MNCSDKDTSVIPQGPYCYTYTGDGEHYICPYYRKILNRPEQADGYCDFLEKGDIELGIEAKEDPEVVITEGGIEVDKNEVPDFIFGGLLWDQVKECGINDEINEEDLI